METIRNKSKFRQGGKLYTMYGQEVEIAELQVLSKRVIFMKVDFPKSRNFGGYTIEYIAENSARSEVAKNLNYLGGYEELFMSKEEQERRAQLDSMERRYVAIGRHTSAVFSLIK